MKICKKVNHKKFTIIIYEQKPNIEYPIDSNFDEIDPDCLGTHTYKIFNEKKEELYGDKTNMWDIGACLENARQDIDCGAVN
jgi:hypothetical protein